MAPADRNHGLASEQVALDNGEIVTIRPIEPSDAPLLQAGYQKLSRDTMYFRFQTFANELLDAEAEHLANVDYRTRMAYIATMEIDGQESIVGVTRYDMPPDGPAGLAYCGVVVGDRLQRQGLGRALFKRLAAYARRHGIRTFVGEILSANEPMLRFIEHSGLQYRLVSAEGGVSEVHVDLAVEIKEDDRRTGRRGDPP
jgi:acetyltransferase